MIPELLLYTGLALGAEHEHPKPHDLGDHELLTTETELQYRENFPLKKQGMYMYIDHDIVVEGVPWARLTCHEFRFGDWPAPTEGIVLENYFLPEERDKPRMSKIVVSYNCDIERDCDRQYTITIWHHPKKLVELGEHFDKSTGPYAFVLYQIGERLSQRMDLVASGQTIQVTKPQDVGQLKRIKVKLEELLID